MPSIMIGYGLSSWVLSVLNGCAILQSHTKVSPTTIWCDVATAETKHPINAEKEHRRHLADTAILSNEILHCKRESPDDDCPALVKP